MMRTIVTFQSTAFNTSESKDYFINPNCFGDDVAKRLIIKLHDAGFSTDSEPGQEDFGWFFNFEVPEGGHCFIIGYRPGEDDAEGDWVGWIERKKGFVGSLLGGRNRGISASATEVIHSALMKNPEVRAVKWHLKEDFDKGNEDQGTSTP